MPRRPAACRICKKTVEGCNRLKECDPRLLYIKVTRETTLVCPECKKYPDRAIEKAQREGRYNPPPPPTPTTHPHLSAHVLCLLTLGFSAILNLWDGGRVGGMERMRTDLAGRLGWRDIFNSNAKVRTNTGRQFIPLPQTSAIQRMQAAVLDALRAALTGWGAFEAVSWTALRTLEWCTEQHKHGDWEPARCKEFAQYDRPLSAILCLSRATIRVWPVDNYDTVKVSCECICEADGSRQCPQDGPDEGRYIELDAGDCLVFVGNMYHAGTAGFPGSEHHPRVHTYLRTQNADNRPNGSTFPCL